ncbi:hypothetical protein HAX54_004217, partial [Datura stramonium]|nr:hypothetical protein [Datura stramonium]
MSQILDHDGTSIIYFDEAFESREKYQSASYLSFITRSGKVVHSKPVMILEEEIHDDKKLCSNVYVASREMNDEASCEEVNEELK